MHSDDLTIEVTFGLKPINHSLCAHARFLFPVNLVSHASIKISWLFASSLFLCLSVSLSVCLSHTAHTRDVGGRITSESQSQSK